MTVQSEINPKSIADPAEELLLDGTALTLQDVARVSTGAHSEVRLSAASVDAMHDSCKLKNGLVSEGLAIYGVTTGFGDSVIRQITPEKATELQRHLIRYHVNGTGPDAPEEVVRATILIRANCLAKGNSGIRPEIVARLVEQLNRGILPRIPVRGSVGASGDLVPLCYVASTLMGEGSVDYLGERREAADVLAEVGLEPVTLEAKEGLALINGTSFSSAFAALATEGAARLARVAELCTAMASESVLGNRGHFNSFIHTAKPHPGQVDAAAAIADLLSDSDLALDHSQVVEATGGLQGRGYAEHSRSIQDRYSLRCAPHIVGVLWDTVEWVRKWVEIEINSSNDNPLFDVEHQEVHSGGNFYGGHVAQAMDSLKVATASIADLLDRQLEHIVDEKFNNGLTPNLIPRFQADEWRAGLHHGFKGMQIACSAITAEALKQSAPASIFSRSTQAHNQDKVSMSAIASRDALNVLELTEEVAAIHLLALCQALDLRGVDRSATSTKAIHALIRRHVPMVLDDRQMDGDIQTVLRLIRSGELTSVLE
jgi:histidine ammonia-lyase/phenylalanine ammonia-lyase